LFPIVPGALPRANMRDPFRVVRPHQLIYYFAPQTNTLAAISMAKNKPKKHNNRQIALGYRKDFYKRLLYIGLCAIPIALFARDTGTYRLVPLPFFIVAMYNLIVIVQSSQQIIDDFFPPKTFQEKTPRPFNKFMYRFATGWFFAGLVCLIFGILTFDNTLNGISLFWRSGGVGIGIAALVTIVLKRLAPGVYYESNRRYSVHAGLFLGFFMVTASAGGFINHYFAGEEYCKTYIVKSKSISGGRHTAHYIKLVINGNEERFDVGRERYDAFESGEPIQLCMLKGRLGYDYVTAFNTVAPNK
jgi:hypothetical protein